MNTSNMQLNCLPKLTIQTPQQPPINSAINGPSDVTRSSVAVASHIHQVSVTGAAKIQQHPQLIQLTPSSQSATASGLPVHSLVAAPNVTKVLPAVGQDGSAQKIAIPSVSHSADTAPIKVQIAPVVQQAVSHTLLQPVTGVSLGGSSSSVNSTPQHLTCNLTEVSSANREAQPPHPVCNGIRIQPSVSVSNAPIQQAGSHQNSNNGNKQQQMLTFHIVQNPKTGAIEFIPVGNSAGKGMTQIQIIPKPIVPKSDDVSKPLTTGGKLAPVKSNGKATEPKSKSAS